MANTYYTHTTYPVANSQGASSGMRAELNAVTAGFDLLPPALGVGQQGFNGGNWQNAALNAGSIVGTWTGAPTFSGNPVFSGTPAFTSPDINGGTIDGAVIGGAVPAAASFTTLAASSTVSGAGFSTYLASPPAIGGTARAAGSFTALAANAGLTVTGGGALSGTFTGTPTFSGNVNFSATPTFANIGLAGTLTFNDGSAQVTAAQEVGQCRFDYVSTTQCILSRYNGKYLTINGTRQVIPAAGITCAATGLTVSTTYYWYAWMNSGVMSLEASTTGHSTDSATGVEIKTGDATRTLVGMTWMAGGPTFLKTGTHSAVLSWFNQKEILGQFASGLSATTSTIWIGQGTQAQICSWAGNPIKLWAYTADVQNNTATAVTYVGLSLDQATSGDAYGRYQAFSVNALGSCNVPPVSYYPAEGIHTHHTMVLVSGGTATYGNAGIGTSTLG